jgi:CheY-like chemotaxis protein
MMTGYSVEQLLDQTDEHGAWGVLAKPIDVGQVLKMLEIIKPDGILIVDDDPDFVISARNLLVSIGYTVFVAMDRRQAIERISSNSIDVLILDLRLPILSGLETYLELKRTGHAVPTVIVIAYFDEYAGHIDRLRSLSASGVLRKPFDPRDLTKAIDHLVHTRKEKRNAKQGT